VAEEDGAANLSFSKLLEMPEMSTAGKLIFGLPINVDNANSGRYDFTQ